MIPVALPPRVAGDGLEYVLTKERSLLIPWLGSLQVFIPQPDKEHMYCTIRSMNCTLQGHRRLHVEVGRQGSYRRYDTLPLFNTQYTDITVGNNEKGSI